MKEIILHRVSANILITTCLFACLIWLVDIIMYYYSFETGGNFPDAVFPVDHPQRLFLRLFSISIVIFSGILSSRVIARLTAQHAITKKREEHLRTILNSIGDAVVVTDAEGIITRMNPVAENLTGWKSNLAYDKPLTEIFKITNSKTGIKAQNPVEQVIDKGHIVGLANHTVLIAKDGSKYHIADSASPILDFNGNITGVVLVFRDVTEDYKLREEIRESEKRYRFLVEKMNDGLGIMDENNMITYANERLCKLIGYTEEEIVDHPLTGFFDQNNQTVIKEQIKKRQKGEAGSYELTWTGKDACKIPAFISSTPLFSDDGSYIGSFSVITDLTKIKHAEKARDEAYGIMNSSPVVAFLWRNTEGWPVEFVSDNVESVLGYKPVELLSGKVRYDQIVYQDDLDRVGREVAVFSADDNRDEFFHEPYRVYTKEGNVLWVEDRTYIRRDVVGKITHYQGIILDITERKQAEEALRESEEKYSSLFHHSIDGILIHEMDGKIIDVNQRIEELFGYTKVEFASIKLPSLHPVSALEQMKWAFERIQKKGSVTFEIEFCKKSGEVFPAEVSSSVFDLRGRTVIQGIVRDITERRKAEESLRESEQLFSSVFDSMQEGVFVLNTEFKYTHWNRSMEQTSNTPREEVLGKIPWQKFPFLIGDVEKAIKKAMNGEVLLNTELEYRLPDGSNGWKRESYFPLIDSEKNNAGVVGVIEDVTKSKQAEKELHQNFTHLQAIYSSLPVIIWSLDNNGIFTLSEGKELALLGLQPGQVVGMSVFELYKDNQTIIESMNAALNGESCEYESEVMGLIFHSILTPFFDENNVLKGLNGLSINVTENRKADEELRQLRNYLTNIINSMPSVLVGVDKKGYVTQWNKTVEQSTGIIADNAYGKKLTDMLPWMASQMNKITLSIRTRRVLHEQKRSRPMDQDVCYEDVTIYPLITNGAEGAVIRIDDVTEKVRLEEMMVQSEKMLSVGGLAAGMAHEINNPLAGMMQTTDVLCNRLGRNLHMPANLKAAQDAGATMEIIQTYMEARGIPRMLDAINESGKRVAGIVDNMLSFARKSESIVSSHDLTELLDKTLELAATDYNLKKQYDFKTIEIIRDYADDLPPVPCESVKIQQVLLNIFRNGAEAMQSINGKDHRFIVSTSYVSKRSMVCIEIEDNGPGMDEATRKRVFEPFFTTKSVGVGTGLGLSVSYFIITENHAGELRVESELGKGTRFIILLPITVQLR